MGWVGCRGEREGLFGSRERELKFTFSFAGHRIFATLWRDVYLFERSGSAERSRRKSSKERSRRKRKKEVTRALRASQATVEDLEERLRGLCQRVADELACSNRTANHIAAMEEFEERFDGGSSGLEAAAGWRQQQQLPRWQALALGCSFPGQMTLPDRG